MVLRCDQTGKLFFSHREAEVHGEETGFQAFSQVSLEEKVWVCEETGKLCFNEQQMDLHKRRVPEAKTFNEKTIADVKAEQDAKVSAGDGEMETEEDIIRREAGLKGGKKGAAAEPAGPPVITKESVDQLLDIGDLPTLDAFLAVYDAPVDVIMEGERVWPPERPQPY